MEEVHGISVIFRSYLMRLRPRILEDSGQGMIEYAVIVALISVAGLAVIVLIGPNITDIFRQVHEALCSASGLAVHRDEHGCRWGN
jgi:pilus assembly protein Flp/PilA